MTLNVMNLKLFELVLYTFIWFSKVTNKNNIGENILILALNSPNIALYN